MGDLMTNYVNPTVFPVRQEFYEGDPPPHPSRLSSSLLVNKGKRISSVTVVGNEDRNIEAQSTTHQAEDILKGHSSSYAANSSAAASSLSSDEAIASTTRDTVVVLITLTIIFFSLIVTYLLWRRKRRCSNAHFSAAHSKLEEYRYSRLSQNDVEVDNISFQGDLTHKTLSNSVPVCAEEDGDDDQVQPATLRLEYDSLVSISNEDKENTNSQTSITKDDGRGDLLIDELSDEDLLQ